MVKGYDLSLYRYWLETFDVRSGPDRQVVDYGFSMIVDWAKKTGRDVSHVRGVSRDMADNRDLSLLPLTGLLVVPITFLPPAPDHPGHKSLRKYRVAKKSFF
jgi:hypothetical protein